MTIETERAFGRSASVWCGPKREPQNTAICRSQSARRLNLLASDTGAGELAKRFRKIRGIKITQENGVQRVMGGRGSGRQGTWATVESCGSVKLDVNRITRDVRGRLRDDPEIEDGPRAWSWTSDGEPWARVIITLTMNRSRGIARLQYDLDQRSRPTGPQNQSVQMETTPCRYGGRRWWWVCPMTQRRCGTLYLPNGRTLFSSRLPGAYRLGYASQDGSAVDRINRRLALRRERLGDDSSEGLAASPPDRPKWMRHRTYARLVAEWESARDQRDEILRRRA